MRDLFWPLKPGWLRTCSWILVAAVAFHTAYLSTNAAVLVVVYLFALLKLAQNQSWRGAFYSGVGVGVLLAAVRLAFFWRIFSGGALGLWMVYAFWIGLFVALARLCIVRAAGPGPFPRWLGWLALPFVWTGLEYFRSELYYLRFSWLSPGYAFSETGCEPVFRSLGTYGLGFVLMAVACAGAVWWRHSKARAAAMLFAGAGIVYVAGWPFDNPRTGAAKAQVKVAGIQMEFPTEKEMLLRLDELVRRHPEAELVVLSEYTFTEPVPERVREWCRKNNKYLIVGGEALLGTTNFYDTAFVVAPSGEICFQQAKAVPVQFFRDGLPAREEKVWDSPWGKIGICICYDLNYTRVTDTLVREGAEALVVPTMDVVDWGERQHELHARIAPVRAAEYGIPIFRMASSGISQCVDAAGKVRAKTPCFAEGAILCGTLEFRAKGRLPIDRWLGPFSTAVTVVLMGVFLGKRARERGRRGERGENRNGDENELERTSTRTSLK